MKINDIPAARHLHLLLVALFLPAAALHAQTWRAIILAPDDPGSDDPDIVLPSIAYATTGSQQFGWVDIREFSQAALWSGTAESFVTLHPAGFDASQIFGASASRQVGVVSYLDENEDWQNHAGLWSGTAESFVDLHPGGVVASIPSAVRGSQQVGVVDMGPGTLHAALWSGTAASFVDLNPSGATDSEARATNGTQQFGTVTFQEGKYRAALWSGTAASFVDLTPPGCPEAEIFGASDSQQVGYAHVGIEGGEKHAGFWSGTAASFVDLHPAGSDDSTAMAADGSWQVGFEHKHSRDTDHACVWSGTAASFVDLHAFLPPNKYAASQAIGIRSANGIVQVSGFAADENGDGVVAVLWVIELPTPPAYAAPAKAKLMTDPKTFAQTVVEKKSATQTLTITNIGGLPLTGLRVSTSRWNRGDFLLTRPSRVTLAPKASATFRVTFKPKAAGNRKTDLLIHSNSPMIKVRLRGRGKPQISQPALQNGLYPARRPRAGTR